MLKLMLNRLKQRADSEYQQSFVKFLTGTVWISYILWVDTFRDIPTEVFTASWLYLVTSAFIFAWIILAPEINILRRMLSILVDTFFTSYAMYATGEFGAPLFGALLFITFGYGLRYGNKYLIASASMSVIGVSTVMATTEYWQAHMPLSYGMIFFIIILCAYVSILVSQLQAAINTAWAASEAKSQFLANMSHEIRTPLHAVIGMSDMLNKSPLNPEQKDFAATIQMSAKSLLALINDILDISKIEAGKTDIEIIDFDLHGLINSTARMLGPEAAAKGLVFHTHISPDVPFLLRGDPQHLKQVLMNLVNNAIKFTHKGNIKIDVSLLAITTQTTKIKFTVTDTGIGIPEKAWPLIFDKFTRADQLDTREYGGTGLGMAIAKQLVTAMHGNIGFSSRTNAGSTFWFELDLEQQGVLSEENAGLPELHDLRVLVINPDKDHGRTIENHLITWGIHYENTRTSAEAIARILACAGNNNPYQVIIVFLQYLDADPLQLLRQLTIRSLQMGRNFILINDGNNRSGQETRALEDGYDYILDSNPSRLTFFRTLHALTANHYYDDANVQPAIADKPEDYKTSITGLRILVGEDNPVSQKVVRNILEYGQHTVTIVANGEQALSVLASDTFDLLILDMHMPVINGIDVVKILRHAFPDKRHMPVIMLTANATKEAVQACADAGFDAYLTKPVAPQKLLDTIAALFASKSRNNLDTDELPLKVVSINNPQKTPLLDIETLSAISRVANNQDFMVKLVEGYIANAWNLIEQTNAAIAHNKHEDISGLAHSLHGSSHSIGASRLALIAGKLSRLTKTENRFMAHTHINELTLAFTQTQSALSEFLNGKNSAVL